MVKHRFKPGDKVIFTNVFGVCWGVKTITGLDERTNRPTYHYEPTDTPWFSTAEEHLRLADMDDLIMDQWGFDLKWDYFQQRYGFTPTDYCGCW
jgi:hypothetical protein